jgi:outer membrane protein assembly factor BamC
MPVGKVRVERRASSAGWWPKHDARSGLYPAVRDFWQERGFALTDRQRAGIGVMETDWVENRAKLPNDLIRSRSAGGRPPVRHRRARPLPHPHRTHRQAAPRSTSATAAWRRSTPASARKTPSGAPRDNDPQLEAEILTRLLVHLGSKDEAPPSGGRGRTGSPGARPARWAASASAGGRRALRPRLAPCRPGAGPQRLHRRGPRPQRRPVLRALCRPQERRARKSRTSSPPVRREGPRPSTPVRYRVA